MAELTGLFIRGSSFYLRVVLPIDHPAADQYRNGTVVRSLGACSKREAITKGIMLRADILRAAAAVLAGEPPLSMHNNEACPANYFVPQQQSMEVRVAPLAVSRAEHQREQLRDLQAAAARSLRLRDVFDSWVEAKPRSPDTVSACKRALALYEEQTGNPPLDRLTRAAGLAFRTWLRHPDRCTTSKTARDRFTWVKSLLKHAQRDMEVISRSPWEGLDIEQNTTYRRRPWTDAELETFFSQPLHQRYQLPSDTKAGADAAYWVPVLGLYTGARISELVQLRRKDIEQIGDVYVVCITDQGEDQRLKTSASVRKVPLHSELIRLGFLDYVKQTSTAMDAPLWPAVPRRQGKTGGFFSQWFGSYRRALGFDKYPDFHCLRHTVRSALANSDVPEPTIDQLVGHEVKGSTGAKVYTHRTVSKMKATIEQLVFPTVRLLRVYPCPSTSIDS